MSVSTFPYKRTFLSSFAFYYLPNLCVEVREWLTGFSSLLLPFRLPGCQQTPLPSEPSHWIISSFQWIQIMFQLMICKGSAETKKAGACVLCYHKSRVAMADHQRSLRNNLHTPFSVIIELGWALLRPLKFSWEAELLPETCDLCICLSSFALNVLKSSFSENKPS